MCIRRSLHLFHLIISTAASTVSVATKIWDSPFRELSPTTATIKRQKD
jgi:hypothetical protein